MSDYTKVTDFASKDALAPGNPSKVVKGTEIDAEFELIETAVATKQDEVAGVDATEIGYLNGVTSLVQTQLDAKVGYALAIPRLNAESTATTAARGKCSGIGDGLGRTVPASVFAAGDAISYYCDGSSAVTITQGVGLTLRLAGTTSTGNRTLAARGFATVWFNSATEAVISGSVT